MSSECFIPVANPQAALAPHLDAIRAAMDRVLTSGRYVLGPEVEAFELEFAACLGDGHAVGVANGTDALELALRAVGVEPGDEVITVANTVTATVSAITAIGARPRFVDIDSATFGMSVQALAASLRLRPARAVLPVHLYGHPVDMSAVCNLARQCGAVVVEDCSQALGARWDGTHLGRWGDAAAFSFYPTKNLGCLGDGGLVLTRDPAIAGRVRALRQYGWTQRYVSAHPGRNSRLDEMQAAILRVLLPHLDSFNARRTGIAQKYLSGFSGTPVRLPETVDRALPVYHQFVIRVERRDEIQQTLNREGIGTSVLYPVPIHHQPGHAQPDLTLPATEAACRGLLCLPIYPGLVDHEVQRVIDAVIAAST